MATKRRKKTAGTDKEYKKKHYQAALRNKNSLYKPATCLPLMPHSEWDPHNGNNNIFHNIAVREALKFMFWKCWVQYDKLWWNCLVLWKAGREWEQDDQEDKDKRLTSLPAGPDSPLSPCKEGITRFDQRLIIKNDNAIIHKLSAIGVLLPFDHPLLARHHRPEKVWKKTRH